MGTLSSAKVTFRCWMVQAGCSGKAALLVLITDPAITVVGTPFSVLRTTTPGFIATVDWREVCTTTSPTARATLGARVKEGGEAWAELFTTIIPVDTVAAAILSTTSTNHDCIIRWNSTEVSRRKYLLRYFRGMTRHHCRVWDRTAECTINNLIPTTLTQWIFATWQRLLSGKLIRERDNVHSKLHRLCGTVIRCRGFCLHANSEIVS